MYIFVSVIDALVYIGCGLWAVAVFLWDSNSSSFISLTFPTFSGFSLEIRNFFKVFEDELLDLKDNLIWLIMDEQPKPKPKPITKKESYFNETKSSSGYASDFSPRKEDNKEDFPKQLKKTYVFVRRVACIAFGFLSTIIVVLLCLEGSGVINTWTQDRTHLPETAHPVSSEPTIPVMSPPQVAPAADVITTITEGILINGKNVQINLNGNLEGGCGNDGNSLIRLNNMDIHVDRCWISIQHRGRSSRSSLSIRWGLGLM